MLIKLMLFIIAASAIQIKANIFTCENSTLLYSVKGQDDDNAYIVFQDQNKTRVFYQDPASGLWDHEVDPSEHGKTCDFRVITQPVQQNCIKTTDGGSDRDLQMCSNEKVDPYADQTVAEHMVLVACSSESNAFAKVANSEGIVHFLAAYHSMSQLEHCLEWDSNNFTTTIKNFMRKQTCDDDHHSATSFAMALGPISRLLVTVTIATASLL